ncbi:MAG: barstar family protein [Luteimonas sp.]
MSDASLVELRSVLADPSLSGVYVVEAQGSSDFLTAALALDFVAVAVDLSGCIEKSQALARIAAALGFPDWFGGNWDALADCLADLSWRPAAGYLLLLEHASQWRDAEPEAFDTTLAIIEEAARGWAAQHKPFWGLVPTP